MHCYTLSHYLINVAKLANLPHKFLYIVATHVKIFYASQPLPFLNLSKNRKSIKYLKYS